VKSKFSKKGTHPEGTKGTDPEGTKGTNLRQVPSTRIPPGDQTRNLRKTHTNRICDDFEVDEMSPAPGNQQPRTGRYKKLVQESSMYFKHVDPDSVDYFSKQAGEKSGEENLGPDVKPGRQFPRGNSGINPESTQALVPSRIPEILEMCRILLLSSTVQDHSSQVPPNERIWKVITGVLRKSPILDKFQKGFARRRTARKTAQESTK
jgi:hypothetical protein